MTFLDRVLPKGILVKYENKELIKNSSGKLVPIFTPGEYHLAKYLDKKLPEEWVILTKAELRNRWGAYIRPTTPDIVIASKTKGIMIIEVKDWFINDPKYENEVTRSRRGKLMWRIYIKNQQGDKNPVTKTVGYKLRMMDGIPEISQEIFDDRKKYNLLKCGVYFHNSQKTIEAKKFVGFPNYLNSMECIVFGKDVLSDKVNIDQFIPLIKSSNKIHSNLDWLSKFQNWISPPLHSLEGQNMISERDLDEIQRRYAISRPNVIQKLFGVAGSGKTKIMAIRAASLAVKKRVLVICWNITLKNLLSELIDSAKYPYDPNNIDIFYFQDFCRSYREERDMPFPQSTTYIGDEIEVLGEREKDEIIKDKLANISDENNYDAILIDEGQDFKSDWFKLLKSFLKKNGEMLITFDDKQNIYKRDKPKIAGVGAGRPAVLKKSYRLLSEHIQLANKFSKQFFPNFNKDEENPDIELTKQYSLPFKPEPLSQWKNVENIIEARNKICETLNYLDKEKKLDFSDTVILVPEHTDGIDLKEHILRHFSNRIKISDIFSKNMIRRQQSKKLFTVSDKIWDKKTKSYIEERKLKMSTIQSFKGWARRNVIIFIPSKTNEYFDYRFYTALTRAQEKLFIINLSERYKKFSKDNSSLFSDQL
jgi:hypothetical protein